MSASSLLDIIRLRIENLGPLSIADYMSMCLSDPKHGYYATGNPFGKDGDFITAPEVSQLFGEIIGAWLVHQWVQDGKPANARLVELGPGRGTLMKDIMRVAKALPEFEQAVTLHMVETSPKLQNEQQKTLHGTRAHWHESFADVPEGPVYLIANELFDALPVHQFVKTPNGWHERCVGLDETGELSFGLGVSALDTAALPKQAQSAVEGSVLEVSPLASALMEQIAQRITKNGGAALVIDYGYTKASVGETFQAIRNHEFTSPLATPGQADLTAHVNFPALIAATRKGGAVAYGPISQADFLLQLGLLERAGQLGAGKSQAEQDEIRKAVERLAADNQMGTLFKVLAIGQSSSSPLPFPA
ncbi:class I SAM-dependent methyltransferase [Flexibacterium corallicola]|uniref:class I SAM-dependent methyltransferase n=1 Tax=Flexibacterium corallicola TaxID=3037259 RepID=UPI00286EF209|nr:class I SAM-dependent methyltransferase [Pseudovibrio sp. M1P-2-3]